MIKVMHIVGRMNRGGIETLLMNIYRNIDRNQFKFYFLCYGFDHYDYEDEIYELGGKIIRLPQPKNPIKLIMQIKKIIKTYEIQIVHSHTYYNSAYVMIAAKQCNINARITHSHNISDNKPQTAKRKFYGYICKKIINKYTKYFFACGEEAGASLFDKRKKVKIISNGIDIEKFRFNSVIRKKLRLEHNISNDEIVIGHIGRFNDQKNHNFIIEFYNEYFKINSHSKLLLIGNGELLDEIKSKVNKLGLENNVIFLGSIDNVYDYYNIMDIFILPSLFEGLGMVGIEAQINGLKVLASDNVPLELNVSNTVDFLPIGNEAINCWIEKIEQEAGKRQKLDLNQFKSYNILNVCEDLTILYKQICN